VNDSQYIELTPNLAQGELVRQARVVILSSDLTKLHQIYTARGLGPSEITRGADGNPIFRITDPEGTHLDFTQYAAGSRQFEARGKFLDPRRVSQRIYHVGIMLKDRAAAMPFYQDKLGFDQGRNLPGPSDEYLELMGSGRDV
jgi:hypothetical protein